LEYAQKQQQAAEIDSTIPINLSGKDKRTQSMISSESILKFLRFNSILSIDKKHQTIVNDVNYSFVLRVVSRPFNVISIIDVEQIYIYIFFLLF
jgi:hypothetical protein